MVKVLERRAEVRGRLFRRERSKRSWGVRVPSMWTCSSILGMEVMKGSGCERMVDFQAWRVG